MTDPKNIEKDYYINLEKEQQEILKIQQSNLKFLKEDSIRIKKEIEQNQQILEEALEVSHCF
jgi:hypothetical protein